MNHQGLGVKCSPVTVTANVVYILLGTVFLLAPWIAWMEVKRAFEPAKLPSLTYPAL